MQLYGTIRTKKKILNFNSVLNILNLNTMLNFNNVLNFNTLHYFFKYAKKPYSIMKNK